MALGPGSLIWRLGYPRTSLLAAGRALVLQVMHPVVGAGVRDFSVFRTDPWGRLERTVDSLLTQLFGGADAGAEAQRLREMHRGIRGTGFDGEAYRALDRRAWAWVHLSTGDSILAYHDRFAEPLDDADRRRFYVEWRRVGALLGIPDRDMPAGLEELAGYLDDVVANTLEPNETALELLDAFRLRAAPPPTRFLPQPLWRVLKPLGAAVLHDTTVGMLPPVLRSRLGVPWSSADERRLGRMQTLVRAVEPCVPDRVWHYPIAYRAMRAASNS